MFLNLRLRFTIYKITVEINKTIILIVFKAFLSKKLKNIQRLKLIFLLSLNFINLNYNI